MMHLHEDEPPTNSVEVPTKTKTAFKLLGWFAIAATVSVSIYVIAKAIQR